MNKYNKWLNDQLPKLVNQDIITKEQSAKISEIYPVGHNISFGKLILNGAAATLIGLGVILLFAYNWQEMSKATKLFTIFTLFISSHAIGFYLKDKSETSAEGAFALGTMFMGAAIFLIGQLYHMDSHYPDAILLWSIGALVMAWVRPSIIQTYMSLVLISIWHYSEVFDFEYQNQLSVFIIAFGIIPLAWKFKSPTLARLSSVALILSIISVTIGRYEEASILLTLLIGINMLLFKLAIRDQLQGHEQYLLLKFIQPAYLIVAPAVYLITFDSFIKEIATINLENITVQIYLFIAFIVNIGITTYMVSKKNFDKYAIFLQSVALSVFLPVFLYQTQLVDIEFIRDYSTIVSLVFNLIVFALSIKMMIDGTNTHNSTLVKYGFLIFSFLVMTRFVNFFDSLILRGAVFVALGIALFVISHKFNKTAGNKQ